MAMSTEEYLEKKVRGVIEPMVSSLLIEKPSDHVKLILILDEVYD
jgi:hypothetical protein